MGLGPNSDEEPGVGARAGLDAVFLEVVGLVLGEDAGLLGEKLVGRCVGGRGVVDRGADTRELYDRPDAVGLLAVGAGLEREVKLGFEDVVDLDPDE